MKNYYYTLVFILLICVGSVSAQYPIASWPLQGNTNGVGSPGITVHPVTLGSGIVIDSWVNAPTEWCHPTAGCSGMKTRGWTSSTTSLTKTASGGTFLNGKYVEFSFTLNPGEPSIQVSNFIFDITGGFNSNCTGQAGFAVYWSRNSSANADMNLIAPPSLCTYTMGWVNPSDNGTCVQYDINTAACSNPFPMIVNPGDRIRFRVYIGTTYASSSTSTHWRALFGNAQIQRISPLAVTLNDFSANCENNETVLNWSTSSENNSSHFEIERSEDTQVWETVTTVPASGNSSTTRYYSAKDINRFTDIGYYRLREVDNDGVSQVYNAIAVNCSSNQNSLLVYPNPSNGDFSVEVNSAEPLQEAAVVIYDISGKQVQKREINHSMLGSNIISFSNTRMEKGAYLIVVESKNKNNFKPEKLVIN